MVAIEILKTAGFTSPAATALLTSALGAAPLLGILEGKLPPLQTFANYYSSYINAISIGSQTEVFTIDELTSEIGAFSVFIKFIMVFLAALCLNACDLEQLITLATSLSLRLGAEHRCNVLRLNLTVALETSLNNFGTSIKTWIKIPVVGPPPCLNVAVEKLIETRDAIELFQARDLTAFGFMSSSETMGPPKTAPPSLKRAEVDDDTNERAPATFSKRATLEIDFCRDFLRGECNYVKCKFVHRTHEELQAIPCKRYANFGSCSFGNRCVNKH